MRHVILASDYPVGNEILRVLSTIKTGEVILASASQQVPQGIDKNRIEVHYASVIDPFSLMDLFQEGDIVYNSQYVVDETAAKGELLLYNVNGLRNLLAVASLKKVARVITMVPQTLGWSIPEKATENSKQEKSITAHEIFRQSLEICEQYNQGLEFGWVETELDGYEEYDLTESLSDDQNAEDQEPQSSSSDSGPSIGPKAPSGPSSGSSMGPKSPSGPSSGPSIGPKAPSGPSSGPSIGPKAPSAPSSGPSMGPKAPSGLKTGEIEGSGSSVEDIDNDNETTSSHSEIDHEVSEKSNEPKESKLDHVPLVIARLPRLFGPFDEGLTVDFCRDVRLQKIKTIGKLRSVVSWINPIDAGRAMVFLGDQSVPVDMYNIIGFKATGKEVLDALSKANYSDLRIRRSGLFFAKIKYLTSKILRKLGIRVKTRYLFYKSINVEQDFSDQKARKTWGWEPRYDLDESAKVAIEWFIEYILDVSRYQS